MKINMVKSKRVYYYTALGKFGELIKDSLKSVEFYTYDKFGNELTWQSYDQDGKSLYRSLSIYNDKNQLIKRKFYKPKEGGQNEDQIFSVNSYIYNKNGKLIEKYHENKENRNESKTTKIQLGQDEDNLWNLEKERTIYETDYDRKGKFLIRRLYDWEEEKNVLFINFIEEGADQLSCYNNLMVIVKTYNDEGNIIKQEEIFRPGGNFEKFFEYDKFENRIIVREVNNIWEDYENIGHAYEVHEKTEEIRYTIWEMDKNGHVLKELKTLDGKPDEIIEYEIKYFKR